MGRLKKKILKKVIGICAEQLYKMSNEKLRGLSIDVGREKDHDFELSVFMKDRVRNE